MVLKKFWQRYSRKKRWWTILLDFSFMILVVAMLIPATRKPLSAFFIRHTLFSPSEIDEVVFMDRNSWSMGLTSIEDEEEFELERFKGKPVFVNFWATWCPPCIAEMPSIQSLYDDYKDEIAFVLVSNEKMNVIDNFLDKHAYSFPVYRLTSAVPSVFETSTIPSTYLIGPSGRILIDKKGAAKWDSRKMRKLIDDLLEKN